MVSWIAANASLRYLFVIFDFLNLAVSNQNIQSGFRKPQDMLGHFLELLFLVLADVIPLTFRKSVHEKSPVAE